MLRKLFFQILFPLLFLTACQPSRMVYYNFASIEDHKIFAAREIHKGNQSFSYPLAKKPEYPEYLQLADDSLALEEILQQDKSVAFLIIHKDSIQYENYFEGYSASSLVASFSMAKSVLSMLVGLAIEEGYIQSVQDKVGDYIPEIKDSGLRNTSLLSLLQMTSGLKFNESYINPFGHAASYYYGRNLEKRINRLKIDPEKAGKFEYQSGNSQLLGAVLARALGEQYSLSSYLEEKIWQPLGMEYDASWSTDDQKEQALERTFCCLNARARDFAKLGSLYLHKGEFNQRSIIPAHWIETSTRVDTTAGSAKGYQYQWWLPTEKGDFMADGLLGQYIYVHPQKDLVLVRLGKKRKQDWEKILTRIADYYD